MPSPPFSITFLTSSGLPIFPTISTCLPSLDTLGSVKYFFRSFLASSYFFFLSVYLLFSASVGSIITSPLSPSSTISLPSSISSGKSDNPTTAGISSALASIAECDVFPPNSVTIPSTFSGLSPAVIDGVRSFATRILPCGSVERSLLSSPIIFLISLSFISLISAALCCISSSSIEANTAAY